MPEHRKSFPLIATILVALLMLAACGDDDGGDSPPSADPFALPAAPPSDVYDGPLFALSHDYPRAQVPPPDPAPWREAIGFGRIDTGNARAYVEALKDYIADDMRELLFDYENWDAEAAGWYNQPWLGTIREPIHGTYVGSTFPAQMFPLSGLTTTMTTHVLVYYDAVAAGSLRSVWGDDALDPLPGLEAGGAQFPEGGFIVKPAFTTAGGADWPPIEGAYPWLVYAPPGDGSEGDPVLQTVYLFQFDIIVKDTASAPSSGWVFATLVYDGSVEGDFWDQMIPLGAMWGNDPDVLSPQDCDYLVPGDCPPLFETWINQATPLYSRETLGWGGRLSGPNDGSVDIAAVVETDDGLEQYDGRYAMSSCMSCHGVAEFEMESFLLPGPSTCSEDDCTPTFASCDDQGVCQEVDPGPGVSLVYYDSQSAEFSRWFQSRPGDEPQDEGTIALDYGMNYAFKALPQWLTQTGTDLDPNFVEEFNNYRGRQYESLAVGAARIPFE